MSKWTESELLALDAVRADQGIAAYHRFGAITNYSKTYDAFEVKRRRFKPITLATIPASELSPRPETEPERVVGQEKDYVGFTTAFFDIETTFSMQPIVLYAAIGDNFGNITQFKKGDDITNDRDLVVALRNALKKYDIVCGWNSKLFDQAVINGRLAYWGEDSFQPNMHVDLMWYASGNSMKIGRRSLQSVSEYFDTPNRKTPLSVRTWDKAMAGDEDAYNKIVEHCDQDIFTLRDVFRVLKKYVRNIHK